VNQATGGCARGRLPQHGHADSVQDAAGFAGRRDAVVEGEMASGDRVQSGSRVLAQRLRTCGLVIVLTVGGSHQRAKGLPDARFADVEEEAGCRTGGITSICGGWTDAVVVSNRDGEFEGEYGLRRGWRAQSTWAECCGRGPARRCDSREDLTGEVVMDGRQSDHLRDWACDGPVRSASPDRSMPGEGTGRKSFKHDLLTTIALLVGGARNAAVLV